MVFLRGFELTLFSFVAKTPHSYNLKRHLLDFSCFYLPKVDDPQEIVYFIFF